MPEIDLGSEQAEEISNSSNNAQDLNTEFAAASIDPKNSQYLKNEKLDITSTPSSEREIDLTTLKAAISKVTTNENRSNLQPKGVEEIRKANILKVCCDPPNSITRDLLRINKVDQPDLTAKQESTQVEIPVSVPPPPSTLASENKFSEQSVVVTSREEKPPAFTQEAPQEPSTTAINREDLKSEIRAEVRVEAEKRDEKPTQPEIKDEVRDAEKTATNREEVKSEVRSEVKVDLPKNNESLPQPEIKEALNINPRVGEREKIFVVDNAYEQIVKDQTTKFADQIPTSAENRQSTSIYSEAFATQQSNSTQSTYQSTEQPRVEAAIKSELRVEPDLKSNLKTENIRADYPVNEVTRPLANQVNFESIGKAPTAQYYERARELNSVKSQLEINISSETRARSILSNLPEREAHKSNVNESIRGANLSYKTHYTSDDIRGIKQAIVAEVTPTQILRGIQEKTDFKLDPSLIEKTFKDIAGDKNIQVVNLADNLKFTPQPTSFVKDKVDTKSNLNQVEVRDRIYKELLATKELASFIKNFKLDAAQNLDNLSKTQANNLILSISKIPIQTFKLNSAFKLAELVSKELSPKSMRELIDIIRQKESPGIQDRMLLKVLKIALLEQKIAKSTDKVEIKQLVSLKAKLLEGEILRLKKLLNAIELKQPTDILKKEQLIKHITKQLKDVERELLSLKAIKPEDAKLINLLKTLKLNNTQGFENLTKLQINNVISKLPLQTFKVNSAFKLAELVSKELSPKLVRELIDIIRQKESPTIQDRMFLKVLKIALLEQKIAKSTDKIETRKLVILKTNLLEGEILRLRKLLVTISAKQPVDVMKQNLLIKNITRQLNELENELLALKNSQTQVAEEEEEELPSGRIIRRVVLKQKGGAKPRKLDDLKDKKRKRQSTEITQSSGEPKENLQKKIEVIATDDKTKESSIKESKSVEVAPSRSLDLYLDRKDDEPKDLDEEQ